MAESLNHIRTSTAPIAYTVRDGHQVMGRFDLQPEDLLQLCGGVPRSDLLFVHVNITSITENTLTVAIDTDHYQTFRTINFASRRISNDQMRVFTKGEHIGTSLFLNQVVFARQREFRKLAVYAMEYDMDERVDGYYRWARLGYEMTDRNDLEDFAGLMRYSPVPAKTLSELVLTDAGYAFWKEQGFDWTGEFLLADDSPSMRHLRQYLELKGIAISL